ncbi:MAG TPA: hypothetical protein VFE51_28840 [Verrucomicrobiae bacterium]|nr:hypothetical protein [Verrucomicrobiae bacterium]
MGAIDLLLNVAGLLLWISWRSQRFDPLVRSTPVTLVGTLKRAETKRLKGVNLALVLVSLVVLRAVLYWLLGAPANWTPKINLELVVLAFRGDLFGPALLYSGLSFLRMLMVFYFWLLVVAMLNRNRPTADPIDKLVRLHLGKPGRWPWPLQVLLPFLATVALWMGLHPLLVRLGVVAPTHSMAHLAEQGLLVGLGLVLSLKYLLTAILLAHLVSSYIYLGTSPIWDFIAQTAGGLTAPLHRLPLRLARVDLAPALGVVVILCLLEWLPNFVLSRLAAAHLSAWPL